MTAPLVRAARFIGFKSLADVTLPLGSRFVLIVGRNASGKSSLLDGMHLISQLCVSEDEEHASTMYRWGRVFRDRFAMERLRTRGCDTMLLGLATNQASFWTRAEGKGTSPFSVAAQLAIGGPDQIEHPTIGRGRITEVAVGRTSEQDFQTFFTRPELEGLGAMVRLRLSADRAAAATISSATVPRVEEDGHGLPAVLNWLAANEPETRARIVRDLARVVPGVKSIRGPFTEVPVEHWTRVQVGDAASNVPFVERHMGHALEIELHDSGYLPADLVSEGTLLTLALLTVVHASNVRVLLLDDIDRGLHPAAQMELVACLRRVLEERPDLQIVATTHSPYLVDEMSGDEIVVLRADSHGHTQARLLSDHPEWSKFEGSLGTGEFWSSVGDEWVSGEHATAAE